MTITTDKPVIPPMAIQGILHANWAVHTLKTAVELDVFSPLSGGPASAGEVSARCGLDARATGLLLDALCGLDLLRKTGGKYELTEVARHYLVPGSELFMGSYFRCHDALNERWRTLPQVIRSGQPAMEVNQQDTAEEFFPQLAAAIFPMNYSTAQMVADELEVEKLPAGSRVLDIGAGSAVWSIPIARKSEAVRVDALDFPKVLEDTTSKFVERFGLAGQYGFLPGNWRDVALEEGAYDMVVIGHVLHSEGEDASAELLRKCHKAMKPGARLVVAEFMPNEERTEPAFPLMFALNMLLATSSGCVFTLSQMDKALRGAGFKEIHRMSLPFFGKESPVVVATRGEG